jgi:ElaB/YqjD/DUF883 family membrane-anchored ribosome-binding protein
VAPTINTANAAIHGAVVWAITGVTALVLLATAVSSAVQGVASTGAAVRRGAVAAVDRSSAPSMDELGLASDDLLAPINQRLAAEGMPPVTAASLEAAARDVLRRGLRGEQIDRNMLVQALSRNTRLSQAEANRIAERVEQRLTDFRTRAGELEEQAKRTALQAAETTGQVLLVLSILMILGLGASIGGAIVSVKRERREHVVLPRAQTTVRSS